MQYINLGHSGLKVSRIGLGMMSFGDPKWREWILDEKAAYPIVKYAFDQGVNFFDTANFYSLGASETVTGNLLKKLGNREQYVIATKVYIATGDKPNQGGLSRKHILHAIDDSLKRLNTDYIDLYQIHRWDWETPIAETMETLHDLIKIGKVRYIGASTMYAWQFAKAQYTAEKNHWTKFISMQNHYNLVFREEEREMNPMCADMGVGLIPWSPLARGFLAGKHNAQGGEISERAKTDSHIQDLYYQENDFAILEQVKQIAAAKNVANAQIALAWLLHKTGVAAPIIGATKLQHVEDAVHAVDIKLTEQEIAQLEKLYQAHEIRTFAMHDESKNTVPK